MELVPVQLLEQVPCQLLVQLVPVAYEFLQQQMGEPLPWGPCFLHLRLWRPSHPPYVLDFQFLAGEALAEAAVVLPLLLRRGKSSFLANCWINWSFAQKLLQKQLRKPPLWGRCFPHLLRHLWHPWDLWSVLDF